MVRVGARPRFNPHPYGYNGELHDIFTKIPLGEGGERPSEPFFCLPAKEWPLTPLTTLAHPAQSKRLSGLEVHALMSAGAYATLREGATLRGARNDEYWRNLRAGRAARPNDKLFVWDKFRALLAGAGLHTQEHGDGKLRLGPMTDKHLEEHKPVEVRHGGMLDLNTMEPHHGGLFDPAMVANNKWGKATLPVPLPNPAFEPAVAKLLGLKQNDIREIIAGRMQLPAHLRWPGR